MTRSGLLVSSVSVRNRPDGNSETAQLPVIPGHLGDDLLHYQWVGHESAPLGMGVSIYELRTLADSIEFQHNLSVNHSQTAVVPLVQQPSSSSCSFEHKDGRGRSSFES